LHLSGLTQTAVFEVFEKKLFHRRFVVPLTYTERIFRGGFFAKFFETRANRFVKTEISGDRPLFSANFADTRPLRPPTERPNF